MLLCKPAKKCLHSWTLIEDMRCAKQGRASPRSWALLEPCSHLRLLTSSGKHVRQGSGGKHFPGPHVHLVAACKHPKSFVQSDLNLLKFQTKITEIMDFCLLVYLFDDDGGWGCEWMFHWEEILKQKLLKLKNLVDTWECSHQISRPHTLDTKVKSHQIKSNRIKSNLIKSRPHKPETKMLKSIKIKWKTKQHV